MTHTVMSRYGDVEYLYSHLKSNQAPTEGWNSYYKLGLTCQRRVQPYSATQAISSGESHLDCSTDQASDRLQPTTERYKPDNHLYQQDSIQDTSLYQMYSHCLLIPLNTTFCRLSLDITAEQGKTPLYGKASWTSKVRLFTFIVLCHPVISIVAGLVFNEIIIPNAGTLVARCRIGLPSIHLPVCYSQSRASLFLERYIISCTWSKHQTCKQKR